MKCKICLEGDAGLLFMGKVLSKYDIAYYKCAACGGIQTEEPYWLEEAYEEAITQTDIGMLSRNVELSQVVYRLIAKYLPVDGKFLDYGGGYGILVRLLRDKGLDFYRQDTYCRNLFAMYHDIGDLPENERRFALVTCFEVFEHVYDPGALVSLLSTYADHILFSTLLVPDKAIRSPEDWWYFASVTGQHITLYTLASLESLAAKAGMYLYSNGESLHLLTKTALRHNPLNQKPSLLDRLYRKASSLLRPAANQSLPSLTEHDLAIVREAYNRQQGEESDR